MYGGALMFSFGTIFSPPYSLTLLAASEYFPSTIRWLYIIYLTHLLYEAVSNYLLLHVAAFPLSYLLTAPLQGQRSSRIIFFYYHVPEFLLSYLLTCPAWTRLLESHFPTI